MSRVKLTTKIFVLFNHVTDTKIICISCCAHAFFKEIGWLLADSSQSKMQWRIEFLYHYKRAKASRITLLNIRKLYLYFVYFKLYVYFECMSPQVPLKSGARATLGKLVCSNSKARQRRLFRVGALIVCLCSSWPFIRGAGGGVNSG